MKRNKIKSFLIRFGASLVSIILAVLFVLGLFDPNHQFLVLALYISAFPLFIGVSLLVAFIKFQPEDKDGDDKKNKEPVENQQD